MPQILPGGIGYRCVVFEGKQDLEKRLPKRLRGWQHIEETKFIVLRDQDSADCRLIKQRLIEICREAGRPETLVRIACRELESFYLGDLAAVGQAFDKANLGKQQKGKKFRNPDMLSNPVQELQKLVPDYQKLSGSRKIASQMKIDANRSESFNAIVEINSVVYTFGFCLKTRLSSYPALSRMSIDTGNPLCS